MNTDVAATAAPTPDQLALSQSCQALWLATISLMTAFMRTDAPAHRYLLASRVARNLDTLAGQECFTMQARASFSRLAPRWKARAARFAPDGVGPRGGNGVGPGVLGLLQRLLPR